MIHQRVFTGEKRQQAAWVHSLALDFDELLLIEGEHHQLHGTAVGSDKELVGAASNGRNDCGLGTFLAGAVRVRAADGVDAFEVILALITREGGDNS